MTRSKTKVSRSLQLASLMALLTLAIPGLALADATDSTRQSSGLAAEQREALHTYFELARHELGSMLRDLPAEHWHQRPTPDKWSVGEVVEHLILAEERFMSRVQEAVSKGNFEEQAQTAAVSDAQILRGVQDRSQPVDAPELLQPTGKLGRKETKERYYAARKVTLDFIANTDAPMTRIARGNPLYGTMDLRQSFISFAAHHLRHNIQIAELIEALNKD